MISTPTYLSGISVIICCYNSAKRLPETLKYLANQQFDKYPGLLWEVIIVDNASTDATTELALAEWAKYDITVPLLTLQQPIPGTGHARELGMEHVQYEYILFCDDDNWLMPNYLDLAYNIMSQNERIVGLGGCGIAVCETEPPSWFQALKAAYSVDEQAPTSHGPVTMERGFIYTAGGVFRKTAIDNLIKKGFKKLLSGRAAKSLGAGEDTELCYALILAGGDIYYDERLKFQHLMPAGRINWDYFKKLNHGFGITFPFLMPYKLLMLKQSDRYKKGIYWLYISAIYLLVQDILVRLPATLFQRNYRRVRADLANHFGFLTSLLQHRRAVERVYRELPNQAWILPEFKRGIN